MLCNTFCWALTSKILDSKYRLTLYTQIGIDFLYCIFGWSRCKTNFYHSHDSIKLMPLFKVSVKMKFLFYLAGLTTIVTAKSFSQNELAKYETKLRNYQNMTNIDEDSFQEIWTKGLENRKNLFYHN